MARCLTVMTFNLRHGWADDGAHSWAQRCHSVAHLLERHPVDVIGFQEVNPDQIGFLKSTLPGHLCLGESQGQGPFWEDRPIFLNPAHRVLEVETLSLSRTPSRPSKSWGSRFIRQATRALIRTGGVETAVYNTHLDFDEPTQLHQVRVIWGRVKAADLERPVILMGDFNSTPLGAAYRFLTGGPGFRGHGGDFGDAAAWPQAFSYHHFTGQPRIGYIDWILYRGRLDLARPAEVLYEKHGGLFPSDHFPVRAAFDLDPDGRAQPVQAGGR